MTFLAWLLRAILLTIVINLILRLFMGRRSTPAASGGPAPGRRGPAERIRGALVRDPHCGTYIPQSSAIRVGSGAEALYFCSDRCRSAHAAAHKA